MKKIKWIKKKYNEWMLNRLVKYSGLWLAPEPGVWGLMDRGQEDEILADLYEDDRFVLLLKKYAEQANKAVLISLNQVELGKFLALNGLILKSRRAFKNKNESKSK